MGLGYREGEEDKEVSEEERNPEQQRLNDQPDQEGIELKRVDVARPRPTSRILVLGESKPLFKTRYLKNALLAFNCLLIILGLIILILAVWVRADPEFGRYENSLDISSFYIVCHLLIIAGIIIVLFGFLGCFGVLLESQWMLITYLVIFVLMFLMQVAAVILIFSAPYSHSIGEELKLQLKKHINKSNKDDSSRYFIDYLQQRLQCCGGRDQNDYDTIPVPRSCRHPQTGDVNDEGCATALLRYLKSKAVLIGGVTVPMLLIQLLAKFVCGFLVHNIRKEASYRM